MKNRWINCGEIRSPVASRWVLSGAARSSPKAPTVGTLQTLSGIEESFGKGAGQAAGFSLHAGVAGKARQREKLERLCRYVTRPAVSEKRLSLTNQGKVRYALKIPCRDGTNHVIFEPVDFIARLTALVPKPRVNLTRFHGVFAPHSKHRALVTPAKRGKGSKSRLAEGQDEETSVQYKVMQLLDSVTGK